MPAEDPQPATTHLSQCSEKSPGDGEHTLLPNGNEEKIGECLQLPNARGVTRTRSPQAETKQIKEHSCKWVDVYWEIPEAGTAAQVSCKLGAHLFPKHLHLAFSYTRNHVPQGV